ncbi:hypothetical protein SAMN05421579_10324 [Xenorhabdus japonica]|uniref:Uncharacterized protein n=1 Tax=Xenorhabdus japonica TaxID=53341 RepID=A0A1I4YT13_9GAMM|nr:hypothetical protein SAMN05421579_10324 [Xenorhabdus japonica]
MKKIWRLCQKDNETLNLKFDFYRTAQSGAQELYYSIECRDTTIIELSLVKILFGTKETINS